MGIAIVKIGHIRRMGQMLKTKKLLPLFLNESLRGVAVSWLAIFSSVFIYQRILRIASPRWALAFVFFAWAVFGLFHILGNCLAEELSLRWGLKFQLNLGLVFMGVAFLLFNLSIERAVFLMPAMLVWGFSAGIYWFGWHGLVGKLSVLGEYGQAFGASSFLRGVAGFLAPVAGGALINFGGYRSLFLAAFGVIIIALLATLSFEGKKTHRDTDIKEVLRLFCTHKKVFLAYFSLGCLGMISSSFILYLALILKRELAMGEFFSVSVLLVALIKLFIGRLADWRKRELVVLGSTARSIVWLGRLLTKSVPLLLGLNVVNDLAIGMVGMPLGVLTLEKAIDGHSTGRAVLFREVAAGLGYLTSGIVLGILAILGLPLTVGFVLAIPLALMPMLMDVRGN